MIMRSAGWQSLLIARNSAFAPANADLVLSLMLPMLHVRAYHRLVADR
jgi:hypothetical protein